MNRLKRCIAIIALAISSTIPALAGSIVEGGVFFNPNTIYDTNPQGGSAVSNTLNWTCPSVTCSPNSITSSGAAKVNNGSLGVSASLTYNGAVTSSTSVEGFSIANYDDMLTINGGNGNGALVLSYLISGSITHTSGTGSNQSVVDIMITGPAGIEVSRNGGPLSASNGAGFFGDGTHSDTAAFYIPFTYGTSFAITPDLRTFASFFCCSEGLPWAVGTDFINTARLTSALVYGGTPGSLGSLNNSALIGSTSGLNYGPNGIAGSVPEPATLFLLSAGLALIGAKKLRRS